MENHGEKEGERASAIEPRSLRKNLSDPILHLSPRDG
jgi:hypothetical protein